jgi:enoyl-CoA hydratase/carnithine racemase
LGFLSFTATELLLTGRNIPAQEALQLGLVNAVVPDDQVEAKALDFARAIAANSPDSIIVLMHGKYADVFIGLQVW